MSEPTIISREELKGILRSGGVSAMDILFGDVAYALPSDDWLQGSFLNAWWSEKRTSPKYQPDNYDCEDFARDCAGFAQKCHGFTPGAPTGAGLAFGVALWDSPEGRHAINLAIVKDADGKFWMRWIDPILSKLLSLTPQQIEEGIYDIRF